MQEISGDAIGRALLEGIPSPGAIHRSVRMGWNFSPNELGQRVNQEIINLVLEQRVKPVIGKVVDFEEIPAAIVAMANRETVGRTIVKLY